MISVVIPTFNEEKIIARTLKQFLPYKKKFGLQLIVSDDNSTDKTREIAKEYADLIVINESRRGVAGNRNNGAKYAIYNIIFFIDADITIKDPENFFKRALRFFKNPRMVGVTGCLWGRPDETGFKDKIFHYGYNYYMRSVNFIGFHASGGYCQFVRKGPFEEIGGYNPKLAAGEDYDMFLRIAKKGKVKFSKQLHVYESIRRYKAMGYARTVFWWAMNGVSISFRGKSLSKKWKVFR